MEFYGIFVPVPENWIGIFHLDSRSRKMGMEFAISRSRSRSPKVIPAHGCHRLYNRALLAFYEAWCIWYSDALLCLVAPENWIIKPASWPVLRGES